MRDSTIFYRSFYESIQELPLDSQAKIYNAIFNYSLNGQSSELSGIESAIFTLIKPQLDANNKRYENGKKPKTKPKESEIEAKQKQELSKTEANKNVNVNDNVNKNKNENNIEERKLKFAQSLKDFLGTYSKEMIRAFYDYWSESNPSNTKFRKELEKTWDNSLRLKKWSSNQKVNPKEETKVKVKPKYATLEELNPPVK